MKELRIFCLLVMLGVFGLCGCSNSDNEALQKQMEELQKQNEELSNRLEEMEQKTEVEVTEAPEATMTLAPTGTPEPTPIQINTPTPDVVPEIVVSSKNIYLDNKSQTISVKVHNRNGRFIYYENEDTTVIKCAWSQEDWKDDTTSLTIKPISTGKATVRLYVDGYENEGITINVESYVPKPTPIPEEDFTNKEWISVDGGWEFTIDSVDVHEFCNQFDEKGDRSQCIIVTYSYKNTGYYGFNGEDSLYVGDINIDVYDEEGVIGERYPCTHRKYPSEIVSGTKCSKAQATYALENASDEITLSVKIYRYDIKKYETRKFIVNIEDEGDSLKATATPKPTNTPKPTEKPKATATPKPTATPEPQERERNELLGKPEECETIKGIGFCFDANSVDGITICWGGKNLSGKRIKYCTVTVYFENAVGDPAYNEITNKRYAIVELVGPIEPNDDILICNLIGYVPVCHKIIIGEVTYEYFDGTKDSFWCGDSTVTRNGFLD